MIIMKCDKVKSKYIRRRCGRINIKKLINEKVDNNYIFVQKNKICIKIYIQILVIFYYITLVTTNEKFSSKANQSTRTLNFCLYSFSYKNLLLYFILFMANNSSQKNLKRFKEIVENWLTLGKKNLSILDSNL